MWQGVGHKYSHIKGPQRMGVWQGVRHKYSHIKGPQRMGVGHKYSQHQRTLIMHSNNHMEAKLVQDRRGTPSSLHYQDRRGTPSSLQDRRGTPSSLHYHSRPLGEAPSTAKATKSFDHVSFVEIVLARTLSLGIPVSPPDSRVCSGR